MLSRAVLSTIRQAAAKVHDFHFKFFIKNEGNSQKSIDKGRILNSIYKLG